MNHFFRYRPAISGISPNFPLSLKAFGLHNASKGWEETNPGTHRPHCGIFWIADGTATIAIAGQRHYVTAGNCLFYFPHESHQINVLSTTLSYYWLTFDGRLAQELLASMNFPRTPMAAGPPPDKLFNDLKDSMADYSLTARYHESALVYQLLTIIASPKTIPATQNTASNNDIVQQFKKLAEATYMYSTTTLDSLAKILKCHRTTVTRLLKQNLGIGPNEYINNLRLQKAMQMLVETTKTAAEISSMCGFTSPNYFSRKIKQLTGFPPNHLRHNL